MKNQIIKNIILFITLSILIFISNLNAGNSVFNTVIDAPALAVGNALTGARFSQDAGLTNPARRNQFKPGTFLFSSESRFSGTLSRQLFTYQSISYPVNIIFIHEGATKIPDTRFALNDWNGDGMLNPNERLNTNQISFFNQHRFGLLFQNGVEWNDWMIGMGFQSHFTSILDENGYGFTVNGGIFREWNSSISVGMEVKNITILPMKWSSGIKEFMKPEIFIGGSMTPIFRNSWSEINLFFDCGLQIDERTLDDDFHVHGHGGIVRYGFELNADEIFALRIGRSGKGRLSTGFSMTSGKNTLNYTLSSKQGWGENSNGHVFTFLIDVETMKKWFQ
ncbi:MAG: hypothetical protein QGH24_03990 [Candidatus Marinimicrobia bacterium]|jgi:hypothetical protein|nr:hypothetical protein [Candidatus Neomarinimicrobiota bacterium]